MEECFVGFLLFVYSHSHALVHVQFLMNASGFGNTKSKFRSREADLKGSRDPHFSRYESQSDSCAYLFERLDEGRVEAEGSAVWGILGLG
jgi:hypothetical protein